MEGALRVQPSHWASDKVVSKLRSMKSLIHTVQSENQRIAVDAAEMSGGTATAGLKVFKVQMYRSTKQTSAAFPLEVLIYRLGKKCMKFFLDRT